jgi:hypothetical protein
MLQQAGRRGNMNQWMSGEEFSLDRTRASSPLECENRVVCTLISLPHSLSLAHELLGNYIRQFAGTSWIANEESVTWFGFKVKSSGAKSKRSGNCLIFSSYFMRNAFFIRHEKKGKEKENVKIKFSQQ